MNDSDTSPNILGLWLPFVLGVISLLLLNFLVPRPQPASPQISPQAPVKVSSSLPSFEGASSLFVISKTPSTELLSHLEGAYSKGVKIQLITSQEVTAPYPVNVIDASYITENAVLINGVSWYKLSGPGAD